MTESASNEEHVEDGCAREAGIVSGGQKGAAGSEHSQLFGKVIQYVIMAVLAWTGYTVNQMQLELVKLQSEVSALNAVVSRAPSKDEVLGMIQQHAPYTTDREQLLRRIRELEIEVSRAKAGS